LTKRRRRPNRTLTILKDKPPNQWEWPRICGFVPIERAISFSSLVFGPFIGIMKYTDFISGDYAEVTMAINKAVHGFLEVGKHTHFLILDIDHVQPLDIVQRLARWVLLDEKVKIVGGVNHRRCPPFDPCVYRKLEEYKVETIAIDVLETAANNKELVEVDSMGAGCLMIAREVFEAIEPPWWEWDYKRYDRGNCRSPDAYFCEKAKKAGFKVYADPSTCSPHISPKYGLIDMNTFKAYVNMKGSENAKVE